MTSSSVRYCFPAKCFVFMLGEQEIIRWCQIRKIWRVINQFKATVMHSSHCNHRLVHRSIVLVKQDSLRHAILQAVHEMSLVLFYKVLNYLSSVGLSGRKHYSWYQERLNLMLAKFYCCGTTPSKSSYMCVSANSITYIRHWHRRIHLYCLVMLVSWSKSITSANSFTMMFWIHTF